MNNVIKESNEKILKECTNEKRLQEIVAGFHFHKLKLYDSCNRPMKTFLKWSGNKTQHLNKIIQYVPKEFGTYIEPFVGSGAMFLKLQPKKWIINDINKDLINVWKNIQGKC